MKLLKSIHSFLEERKLARRVVAGVQIALRAIWQLVRLVPQFLQIILRFLWHLPRHVAALCVSLYQKTLSPDHGWLKRFYPYGYCRFTPSCSEYTRQSLKKHGFIWGSLKGFWRICRCNPWSEGGEDKP